MGILCGPSFSNDSPNCCMPNLPWRLRLKHLEQYPIFRLLTFPYDSSACFIFETIFYFHLILIHFYYPFLLPPRHCTGDSRLTSCSYCFNIGCALCCVAYWHVIQIKLGMQPYIRCRHVSTFGLNLKKVRWTRISTAIKWKCVIDCFMDIFVASSLRCTRA